MSLFVILIIVAISTWLLSNVFVFIPIHLLEQLGSWSWLTFALAFLLFLGWCLGDD